MSKKEEDNGEPAKEKYNDKYLYTCESIRDGYEYKKMVKYFPKTYYWAYVFLGTIMNLIFTAIIAIADRNLIATLIFFIAFQTYIMILYKVRLEYYAEKSFNKTVKKGMADTKIHTEFYEDYFIRQGESVTYKIYYYDIVKSIETDTNFYLKYDKLNLIIIIQKNTCDLELINFIRSKFNDLENHLGDTSNFKGVKKYHNPKFIRIFMLILFIITIASLWGALWSVTLINEFIPQHGFSFAKNFWVFWCFLPIPILSILLGIKYKKAGFK